MKALALRVGFASALLACPFTAALAADRLEIFLNPDRARSVLEAGPARPELPEECRLEGPAEAPDRIVCEVEPVVTVLPADELRQVRAHVLGGSTVRLQGSGGSTYGFLVGIERQMTDHLSIEFDYSNDGHFDEHHRDRLSLPVFATTEMLDGRVRLRLGAGPSLFFASMQYDEPGRYHERHGFSLVADLGAEILLGWGTSLEARARVTQDFGTENVFQGLIGVSRELPRPKEPVADEKPWAVSAAGGRTVRIGGGSPKGQGVLVALRRSQIVGIVGAMVAYLRLGDVNERQGGLIAPTIEGRYLSDGRLSLELAVGPYVYADGADNGQPTSGVEAAMLATASYRVLESWTVTTTAGRLAGFSDEGDYDLILVGVGYLF